MVILCSPPIINPFFPSERSWASSQAPLLKWPSCGHTLMSLCLLLAEVWMEFSSSHHHLEHHRACVYCWRIMHPPVTLPQVNVQSVVLLQNYPAGHLILGIWLNFSFNYPVLNRAIEDSHKGPLLLMWTICFLSKNAYLSKAPDSPMGILMRFSGLCDTMQTHCKTPACLTILQMPILLQLIECN